MKQLFFSFLLFSTCCFSQSQLIWARHIGNEIASELVFDIATSNGNVYVSGCFKGNVDLDPGPDSLFIDSGMNYWIYVSKFNAGGHLMWCRVFSCTGSIGFPYLDADQNENVFISCLYGGVVDLDPTLGVNNVTASGYYDFFVMKLTPAGDQVWVKTFGGTGSDHSNTLEVDNSGNVYLAGTYTDGMDADPGPGVHLLGMAGLDEGFVIKLDALGNYVWAVSLTSNWFDIPSALAVDDSLNVYVGGMFGNVVDFDPGPATYNLSGPHYSTFYWKLTKDGDLSWAKMVAKYIHVDDLKVNSSGIVFIAGGVSGTGDIDPGPAFFSSPGIGNTDMLIQRFDPYAPAGASCVSLVYGSPGASAEARRIELDGDNDLYVSGRYNHQLLTGTSWELEAAAGSTDICLLKLDQGMDLVCATSIEGGEGDAPALDVDAGGNIHLGGMVSDTVDLDPGPSAVEITTSNEDGFFVKYNSCLATTVQETVSATGISVFPNPSACCFLVRIEGAVESGSVNVRDTLGKTVYRGKLGNETMIDLSAEQKGIYFMEITIAERLEMKKVVLN
jgi:hypothetical protein